MIVVDASIVLEVILRGRRLPEAMRRVLSPRETLHAPHLLDLEVAQVLRRYLGQGDLSEQRAAEALRDFLDMSVARYPHEPFLGRIWQLRANLTAYDAAYVALAEALDAPLVTRDARLARAAGHEATIELF